MSGGSYDYASYKVSEMADCLRKQDTDPRRAAFAKLLKLVADAMHDVEWVDSCDYGPGDDHASIDAVFAFLNADPATITKAKAYDELRDRMRNYFNSLETETSPAPNNPV